MRRFLKIYGPSFDGGHKEEDGGLCSKGQKVTESALPTVPTGSEEEDFPRQC